MKNIFKLSENNLFSKYLIITVLSINFIHNIRADYDKRALIIAIGNYKTNSGWKSLASLDDLLLMKEMLKRQQFKESNILTIKDSEATKTGIKAKFFQLISLANDGDKIVIHFSGHGQQVTDLNGDEEDGMDEALVPYDAPSELKDPQYRFEKHIIDDEINDWISQLKTKIGKDGHILLILDSCHSGTASRGEAEIRGYKAPLLLIQNIGKISASSSQVSDYFELKNNTPTHGKFVMFTAARASQVNYQTKTEAGKAIGSLTYAVAKAFESIKKGTSYEHLFASISNTMYDMKQAQTPTVEGDKYFQVFDGQYVVQEPTYSVKRIMENGKVIFKVTSGYLSNVFEGAKFDLLPNGSPKNKGNETVARAKVISSNSFESIIDIYEGKIPSQDTELLAQQTEQSFGKYDIGIRFGYFQNQDLHKQLEDALKTSKLISINTLNTDLEISQKKDSIEIKIVATANIYDKISSAKNIQRAVIEAVIGFARAKMISSLEINNPDFSSQINLKHVTLQNHQPVFLGDSIETYPTFSLNQSGWITIKNTGNSDFYFTLLDIQPDGKINIILPDETKGFGYNEVRVESGKEKGFSITKFSPPLGIEKFKVIMTNTPADFSFLNSKFRNSMFNKNSSPLENLFKDLVDGSMNRTIKRGNDIATIPVIGGTASYTFQIVD